MSLAGLESLEWLSASERDRLRDIVLKTLPRNYNFEIVKTLQRWHEAQAKKACLQLPEGLYHMAEALALILEEFSDTVQDVILIGDTTYGACCVDDIKAKSLKCDYLVHYAHSCLVPIDSISIPCLYVFVEILFDPLSVVNAIEANIPKPIAEIARETGKTHACACSSENTQNRKTDGQCAHLAAADGENRESIALLASIQFSAVLHDVGRRLRATWGEDSIIIPQELPLTAGETLGCTSPVLPKTVRICIFVADGRFHLESVMIRNPTVQFYRFDPFMQRFYIEHYDQSGMLALRQTAIDGARRAKNLYIILSTLGRQGSIGLIEFIESKIRERDSGQKLHTVLMAEMNPIALTNLVGKNGDTESTQRDTESRQGDTENDRRGESAAFIQIGCPRLSIDWGHEVGRPLLNPYEAYLAFATSGNLSSTQEYPMDYFAANGGPWSNYGRGTDRNGSVAAVGGSAAKDRLKEKWLKRKICMQNATKNIVL